MAKINPIARSAEYGAGERHSKELNYPQGIAGFHLPPSLSLPTYISLVGVSSISINKVKLRLHSVTDSRICPIYLKHSRPDCFGALFWPQ